MAVKASDNLKFYHNPNGPTITTVARPVIEKDGLYFKDIDGSGEVSAVTTGVCLPKRARLPM
mgnify:CR=1 FL=1